MAEVRSRLHRLGLIEDVNGERYGKANADLDMAVDMLLQSERLDRVMLVSGDGDFVRVVQALQNRGLRIEVIGVYEGGATFRITIPDVVVELKRARRRRA